MAIMILLANLGHLLYDFNKKNFKNCSVHFLQSLAHFSDLDLKDYAKYLKVAIHILKYLLFK